MPTNTIADFTFECNEEGFFTRPEQWSLPLARTLAPLIGIAELTDEHVEILQFMRADQATTGVTPTLRRLQVAGGYDIKRLFELFPSKPAKKMSYLAGLAKPVGCV